MSEKSVRLMAEVLCNALAADQDDVIIVIGGPPMDLDYCTDLFTIPEFDIAKECAQTHRAENYRNINNLARQHNKCKPHKGYKQRYKKSP